MSDFNYRPDYGGATKNTQVRLQQIQFGDGAVYSSPIGINPITKSYDLTFTDRTDEEAKAIADFFESKLGHSFTFTFPGEAEAKWSCSEWSWDHVANDSNDITATFVLRYL